MQLREYQERFVRNIAESLAKNKRVIAQLATGGGKTVTFSAISKRFNEKSGQRVLILVHRIELLDQAARTIKRNTGLEAVKIVAGMKSIPDAQVYVAMVETTYRRLDKLPEFGLIIIDEAHIGNFTKLIEHYSNKYIIGFTATPIASKKDKPLKNYFKDIVCGVSIGELIEQGHLCNAVTFGVKQEIDRSKLKMVKGDFDIQQMAQMMSANKYIESVIESYSKLAPGKKTLVFNCNVEHSILVNAALVKAGLNSRHMDGEMQPAQRKEILDWFNDTPDAILCNIGIATTGFDQPDVECIIVNRATASMPLWLQMCGRGSRPTPDKSEFTIIDMGGNATTHGKWEAQRDWVNLFINPEKKKDGVAPTKQCPECECIVHARVKVCDNCGYEWQAKEIVELEPALIVALSEDINIDIYIEMQRERNYREYFGLIKSLERFSNIALNKISFLHPQTKQVITEQAESIAKRWSKKVGHKTTHSALFVTRKFIKEQFAKHPTWKKSSSLSTQM
jgi:superfamily II DNA or RNA helicase